METVRTPDERFADLPGYPFEPNYVEIDDGEGGSLRMHYVEEGPADGDVILLLHGEPTWSYLYRKMIPGLAAAGHRVIAPDLVGFGKSDKVVGRENYSYTRHVHWVEAFVEALDLRGITLFGQDWGSIVGLAVATRMEDRFDRIVMANGTIADPRRMERMVQVLQDSPMPEAFAAWQAFVAAADELDVAMIMAGGPEGADPIPGFDPGLTPEEAAAYQAPYPDPSHQGGVLAFPALMRPQGEDDDVYGIWTAAWEVLDRWEKPFLCLYGKLDPMIGHFDAVFIESVPGTKGLPHQEFAEAGHFIQEEEPEALVAAINDLIASTPTG